MNPNNLKLNQTQTTKWLDNLIIFVAPVGIVYIVSIIGSIQSNEGALRLDFFIPNTFTSGAIVLYLLNTCLDFLRKKLMVRA